MRAANRAAGGIRLGLTIALLAAGPMSAGVARQPKRDGQGPLGKELFFRVWKPGDVRSHAGDGLGPLYNAMSCFECHRLGGPGGAGPNGKNVMLLIPVPDAGPIPARATSEELADLLESKAGVRTTGVVVLHHRGVDPGYQVRREELTKLTLIGYSFRTTERNTPALFGAGLIDAIPGSVIAAGELRSFPEFPKVRGRVSRLANGRIGRFGWKGQTASLEDFVLSACAVELGLEVPGHHQPVDPLHPEAKPPGLDMNVRESAALVAYVRALPAPTRDPVSVLAPGPAVAGERVFESIGCATCHTPRLGAVAGLYSDLLLHDLGNEASDSADNYYGVATSATFADSGASGNDAKAQEWRTPPLWGFRDTGPYLHDGRARNLDEAVAIHGGEAEESRRRYVGLTPSARMQVRIFLTSLTAPPVARGDRSARFRTRPLRFRDLEDNPFKALGTQTPVLGGFTGVP